VPSITVHQAETERSVRIHLPVPSHCPSRAYHVAAAMQGDHMIGISCQYPGS
jgi:hypothetical protein